MTVHLVYVNEPSIDTTNAIAREVSKRLANHFRIVVCHPNDPVVIQPRQGDVLIGHPNRYGDCAFRRAFEQPGWAKRIVFAPFSHGLLADAAAIDDLVCEADLYLAITGSYWFDSVESTLVSHWRYKMMRCDLGVNREHYPRIKRHFNPAGQRRFLYIGNADPMKGGDYLMQLANANPDIDFGWIRASDSRDCLGSVVEPQTRGLSRRMLGSKLVPHYADWHLPGGMLLAAGYDFILNCGRSDAMPCEVLEGASWGLLPVTTPECGFAADDWMSHVPLGDVAAASRVLRALNECPEEALLARQAAGFRQLETRYHWDHVARQVREAIEAPIPAAPDDPAWRAMRQSNRRRLKGILRKERRANAVGRAAYYIVRRPAGVVRRAIRAISGR